MSITLYKVLRYGPTITPVEVERFTDSSVWINGHRRARFTDYEGYFATWADAHKNILDRDQAKVFDAQRTLEFVLAELDRVKAMKP